MASVHQEPAIQTPPLMARKTPMQWFTNGGVHYVEPLIGGPLLVCGHPAPAGGRARLPATVWAVGEALGRSGPRGRHAAGSDICGLSGEDLDVGRLRRSRGHDPTLLSLPARRPSLRSVAEDHRAPIHTRDAQPRPQIGA